MPGNQGSRVFYTYITLEQRLREVANLPKNADQQAEKYCLPPVEIEIEAKGGR